MQAVTVELGEGRSMELRRVVLRLDEPTRDGDEEIEILTNLPTHTADGVKVAELYRDRWTLETMFQSLTARLAGELNTLGYPRAALLVFGVALTAYNVMSTLHASLRSAFGSDTVQA